MNEEKSKEEAGSSAAPFSSEQLLAVKGPFEKRETANEIKYKVHGFWSSDTVRIWKPDGEVAWSCGGRDHKEEPDDLISSNCFALAIADAVKTAAEILDNCPR